MGNQSMLAWVRRLALFAGALLIPGCGGVSKPEFHTNQPGNFRVLAVGKPVQSNQAVASPAGELSMTSVESTDGDQIRRVVVYTDFPRPTVQASDPNSLLDSGIRGMTGSGKWAVQSQGPVTLDGHPGREVRFAVDAPAASEKGTGKARIFLVGNRLYQAIIVGPASKVSEEELDHFVKSFELLQKVPAIAGTVPLSPGAPNTSPAVVAQAAPPPAQAGLPARPAQDAGPTDVTQEAEPPTKDASDESPAVAQVAPPPAQAPGPTVTRKPASRQPRTAPAAANRAVAPAAENRAVAPAGNAVVQAGDEGPDPSKPAEVAIEANGSDATLIERPAPDGNARDRFREVAPEHGVLVGMRVGYVNALGGSKVGAIQPIFQVGKTYIDGKRFGKDDPPSITVVARPGYAVGAINTRAGLLLDAFQVVFMRFKDGQLDPGDSYTTDWLGDSRGGRPGTATGEGKLVVGVHGRSNGRQVNALGLLVAD